MEPGVPPAGRAAVSTELKASDFGVIGEAIELAIDEISGDRVAVRWMAHFSVHQPAGILHGGVHSWVVETLASVGAGAWLGERGTVVGVSNQTDFYRAVRGGHLSSVGTPVHRGGSQQVWMVETRDDQDRLVARGQVRLANLTPRD